MDSDNRRIIKSLTMITQIGISMMVPIFLCTAFGSWLDRVLGTQICFLIFVFLGIGAAFRNVYILTKSFYSADMKKEHDRLNYIQELKDYSKNHPEETGEYTEIVKKKRYPENNGSARS